MNIKTLRQHIQDITRIDGGINYSGGNLTQFSRDMGISRPTLHRWIEDGALVIDGKIYIPAKTNKSTNKTKKMKFESPAMGLFVLCASR